jgi:hypothetical protein
VSEKAVGYQRSDMRCYRTNSVDLIAKSSSEIDVMYNTLNTDENAFVEMIK